jgi:dihydrofolate synthase/folylpolyglutamate synthase
MNGEWNHAAALEFLFGRINYEKTATVPYRGGDFKLDRMRQLLRRLGDPHRTLRAIHIAGTKGKGSTAVMTSDILRAAGYSVGLYTSPHLIALEERFVVNGQAMPPARLTEITARVRDAVDATDAAAAALGERGTTFFEVTTALAFLDFAERNVDWAVLEVGLGGRLDSTNVCAPVVTAITSISFDHTRQLGNTLTAIAREKAGIIKPGVPVVSGVTADEPREVIQQVARDAGAPVVQRDDDFTIESAADGSFTYREPEYALAQLRAKMPGEHQQHNGGVAVAICRQLRRLGWTISETDLRRGLETAAMPARIEFIPPSAGAPPVVLDGAHNVASMRALVETLRRDFPQRPRALIFATSKDKDLPGMLRQLWPEFDAVFLTRYVNNPRTVETDELWHAAQTAAAQCDGRGPTLVERYDDPHEAWSAAVAWSGSERLCVIAGSFFLAADLGPRLRASPPQSEPEA